MKDLKKAYNLFHKGIEALGRAEQQGIRIDMEYAEKTREELTEKIEQLHTNLTETTFYKEWRRMAGEVNINSGPQLGKFLYGYKKIKPAKATANGTGSTDEEALKILDIPELDIIIEIRKLRKLRDTYLEQFFREAVDGVIHPVFNLHTVVTYRSSSDSPNFQNIPKRDKEAMHTIRKAMYPRVGHQIMEVDFSGLEVSIAACYHKDPNMLKYLTSNGDMHGDMASQIFMIKNFDKSTKSGKTLRAGAKNGFVFPQFYGDYYRNNAMGLCQWAELPESRWKGTEGLILDCGTPISAHLIKNGIRSFEGFVEHIKKIEQHFWSKRFPVYAKWKETHLQSYKENGYVELHTGFICQGEMRKNEVINFPVQGAAFHCLLWCFIRLEEVFRMKNMKTRLIGQIHDAIILDVSPDELGMVGRLLKRVMTRDLLKEFPWIIVPLGIAADLAGVDKSYAEVEPYKL